MSYSDDELPELSELLGTTSVTANCQTTTGLRRSPRKKMNGTGILDENRRLLSNVTATFNETKASAAKGSLKKPPRNPVQESTNMAPKLIDVPILSKSRPLFPVSATSNNESSPQYHDRPIRLPQIDSLVRPLSRLVVDNSASGTLKSTSKVNLKSRTSKFVLKEARCNDDEEDSLPEEEDEDTDLSGFIVDDNADLSHHEWSDGESIESRKKEQPIKPRRRLQRGSPQRRRRDNDELSHGEDNDLTGESLVSEMRSLSIEKDGRHTRKVSVEVIDLTQSPENPSNIDDTVRRLDRRATDGNRLSPKANLVDLFNHALKLSPPSLDLFGEIMHEKNGSDLDSQMTSTDIGLQRRTLVTPPATPPRSPSKLKSPSKLLSPSKRDYIPRSPHRQSTDAFWDLHTINSWNDQYSPKKAPVASPGKRGLARFHIWSDDSAEEDLDKTSSSSIPSPCSSPTKLLSPTKSPEKAQRELLAAEKKASKARKASFDAIKETMALDLLAELDAQITCSQLSSLAASTGGVQIIWSKTLRSTAGRANWRRTVTKSTGSPIKINTTIPEGPGVTVQHFATIELASKVIDSVDRLVNTLAHEFCHLANFMVSNIRDQPHGASFKSWARKVTSHLQKSDNEVWRKVEVTTKHSYKIDHKYLWVCMGRERSKAAEFLNLEEEEGCGAEYGRHSRSIDTEKQRCGRCKGRLVQLRPKVRGVSPVKKTERVVQGKTEVGSGGKGTGKVEVEVLERAVEVVELSD